MTEAGKEWVASRPANDDWDWNEHFLSVRAADFWLRAFCKALESTAREYSAPDDDNDAENICLGIAYKQLKLTLLGGGRIRPARSGRPGRDR